MLNIENETQSYEKDERIADTHTEIQLRVYTFVISISLFLWPTAHKQLWIEHSSLIVHVVICYRHAIQRANFCFDSQLEMAYSFQEKARSAVCYEWTHTVRSVAAVQRKISRGIWEARQVHQYESDMRCC